MHKTEFDIERGDSVAIDHTRTGMNVWDWETNAGDSDEPISIGCKTKCVERRYCIGAHIQRIRQGTDREEEH